MITAGFIGCGNMGGALCSAAAKAIGGENIYASDFISEKATMLCETPLQTKKFQNTVSISFLG